MRGIARPGPLIKTLPPVWPAHCGAKATFTVTLCPGPSVRGNWGPPLRANSFPTVCSDDSVIFQRCVFVNTTGAVALDPIATEPNDKDAGLGVIDSLVAPVPET